MLKCIYSSSSDTGDEGGLFLIFGNFRFEKIRFLFHIHQLGKPGQRVCAGAIERLQADAFEAAVADVIDVGEKLIGREAYGMNRQAILDELLLQTHGFGHGGAQIFPEVCLSKRPDSRRRAR